MTHICRWIISPWVWQTGHRNGKEISQGMWMGWCNRRREKGRHYFFFKPRGHNRVDLFSANIRELNTLGFPGFPLLGYLLFLHCQIWCVFPSLLLHHAHTTLHVRRFMSQKPKPARKPNLLSLWTKVIRKLNLSKPNCNTHQEAINYVD